MLEALITQKGWTDELPCEKSISNIRDFIVGYLGMGKKP